MSISPSISNSPISDSDFVAIEIPSQSTREIATQTEYKSKRYEKATEVASIAAITFVVEASIFYGLSNLNTVTPLHNAVIPTMGYILSQLPVMYFVRKIFQ